MARGLISRMAITNDLAVVLGQPSQMASCFTSSSISCFIRGLGQINRVRVGSLALRPALLLFGNSRQRVTTSPLPHTTGVYGQLPGRDFNPLDLLLLLRTVWPLLLSTLLLLAPLALGKFNSAPHLVLQLSPR